jgi:hypothetical protein
MIFVVNSYKRESLHRRHQLDFFVKPTMMMLYMNFMTDVLTMKHHDDG